MKKLLFLLPFFLLGTACSSDEENNIESPEEFTLSESIPKDLISKSEMPFWLSEKVQDIEDNLKPLDRVMVYQGVWKEKTVYHIWSHFYSCMYCEVYDQQGTHFDWTKYDGEDFTANSHDWKVIYIIE